jgi:hypothetical protein
MDQQKETSILQVIPVLESYTASTALAQEVPQAVDTIRALKGSTGAFQLLLHGNQTSHFVLDTQYSLPDALDIPIFRISINSPLPVSAHFLDYYRGQGGVEYADKLTEVTAQTYSADRYTPIYIEIPLGKEVKSGDYPVEVSVYQAGIIGTEKPIKAITLTVSVIDYQLPEDVTVDFDLDIWQQPSNLARTFKVPLWSDAHFRLIDQMAHMMAKMGQKAVTVIAGEIPWKGWFSYIIKDYPANLYEYSMVKVIRQVDGKLSCDYSALDRYVETFFAAGVKDYIDVFGLLGVWTPPFFPLIKTADYPEPLVVRYYDERQQSFTFVQDQGLLREYLSQLFTHFKQQGWWGKVRLFADEPQPAQVATFKASIKALKGIDSSVQIKVAMDKEDVLADLIDQVDYPALSFYTASRHGKEIEKTHSGRTQFYICNYPERPNTYLHSSLLEARMQGPVAYMMGMNGLLRWAFNCWPENARKDIRYNVSSLPIGDLCLCYPGDNGNILPSMRMQALHRGLEDYWLLKQAEKVDQTRVKKALATLVGSDDPSLWMTDRHHTAPEVFHQTAADFDRFRQVLLEILTV